MSIKKVELKSSQSQSILYVGAFGDGDMRAVVEEEEEHPCMAGVVAAVLYRRSWQWDLMLDGVLIPLLPAAWAVTFDLDVCLSPTCWPRLLSLLFLLLLSLSETYTSWAIEIGINLVFGLHCHGHDKWTSYCLFHVKGEISDPTRRDPWAYGRKIQSVFV